MLSSMGFKMAPQIVKNAKLAENFMQQAKDLEEVQYATYIQFLVTRLPRNNITGGWYFKFDDTKKIYVYLGRLLLFTTPSASTFFPI